MESTVNAQPRRWPRTLLRIGVLLLVGVGVLRMFGGSPPKNLGVTEGKLAPCPDKPNCVSTQAEKPEHRIEPLKMQGSLNDVTLAARYAIQAMPRAKFAVQKENYCHVECTSLICRFVDDLELCLDEDNQLIHARSASRVGYSDLGVNRKRVEALFDKLVEAKVASRID